MFRATTAVTALVACLMAAGCGSSDDGGGSTSGGGGDDAAKKYKIFLSNNYVGNEWRPQMLNYATYMANTPEYRDKVELEIRNVELTPAAQIQSLQSIIRQKPDAIMIDAASPTALNPTVEQACKAGILVYTFDQAVTAPCAYKLRTNYAEQALDMVNWLGTALKGKGNILVDTGLPGIPISEDFTRVWKETLAEKWPDLNVVGTFSSQYAPGPELQGVSSQLARNPQIDGILSGGYCASSIKALERAGRDLVPLTCFNVNGNMQACTEKKVPCFYFTAPAWVSGLAIEHIVDILSETAEHPKEEEHFTANFVSEAGDFEFPHVQDVQVLEDGVNYLSDGSPSLIPPLNYGDWKATPADLLGS